MALNIGSNMCIFHVLGLVQQLLWWEVSFVLPIVTVCVLVTAMKEGDICLSADAWRYKFQCEICLKRLRSSWELRDHKNSVHFKVLAFSCDTCGKKFAYKRSLKRHAATTCGVMRPFPKEEQWSGHIGFLLLNICCTVVTHLSLWWQECQQVVIVDWNFCVCRRLQILTSGHDFFIVYVT